MFEGRNRGLELAETGGEPVSLERQTEAAEEVGDWTGRGGRGEAFGDVDEVFIVGDFNGNRRKMWLWLWPWLGLGLEWVLFFFVGVGIESETAHGHFCKFFKM